MSAELSIIIVNWNGGGLLRRAVESVVEAPPAVTFDVVVIDNASSDDSLEQMRASATVKQLRGDQLRVHLNAENLGFSKANNQGFAESSAPLLLLLNSDAEVRAGAIDKLVETLRLNARTGACGPRLVNFDGTLQPSVFRNPPTAWETLVSGFRLDRLLPSRLRGELLLGGHWDHLRRRTVPRLSGAALLVRREAIDEVGGLDERFHMYGEDVEWCLRMMRAGWQLVHEPEAVVMHHGSGSSKQRWGNLETTRRIVDGQLRFQEYCLSRPQRIRNIAAGALVAGVSSAWQKVRGGSREEQSVALALYGAYFKRAVRKK